MCNLLFIDCSYVTSEYLLFFFHFAGQEAELDVSALLQKIKEVKDRSLRQNGLCLVCLFGRFLKLSYVDCWHHIE